MAAVASNNRAASVTFLLALILTSSCWCLASAIPAHNGRRLQQFATTSGEPARLQALADGVTALSNEVKSSLQRISPSLPSGDLLSQLENVAASLATAATQLQATVQSILAMVTVVPMPQAQATTLEALLSELEMDLQTFTPLLQSTAPAGGCFTSLQSGLVAAIKKLASNLQVAALQNVPGGSASQAQSLITSLQNIGVAVSKVDSCAPGLQTLQGSGQGLIAAITALATGIQAQ